ncbi:3-oxoacyl-[acyl-carrier-protein] synthase 3 protein 4 [Kitasatospora herbaricolor]|uniref:beta-ketoacyl-ACP synthase III n=1 Tax=Kitasatospora herbaricolor TaxID=68217 RepID=UPI0017485B20|nr:beta-ketoacyl-ACP synthase III [Kitasatospora herbaricolor]MDQ0308982.1 3-oxoacyl-[acyl-carrier-protein] synthase-3 [Kitasatospora herbaricolor]GGV02312.1 3-oxoacyl-[acyl-carrier-protein] synthase 3 protein 4 [Kitasatospora herbaricolor]
MSGSRIVALGHYQPPKVLTNAELSTLVDTDDEWIRSRVGIRTRHIAVDESLVDLATEAAQKALANSGRSAADVDLVVVATCTAVERSPNTAAAVAARLGVPTPAAYDINTVCSGFSYALATADHAIRAGAARLALVVGAERMSDTIDWTDRTTCVIFGDGAGAAVVEAQEEGGAPGIGPVVWGSEPEKGDAVVITGWDPTISQQGQSVFRWATTKIAPLARQACEKAGIDPSELKGFVPHQANLRIIDAIANKLGAPDAVIARDVVDSGNTSAASIPLAFSKLVERGELASGDPVLLFGFGGGLAYAGQVVRCP